MKTFGLWLVTFIFLSFMSYSFLPKTWGDENKFIINLIFSWILYRLIKEYDED